MPRPIRICRRPDGIPGNCGYVHGPATHWDRECRLRRVCRNCGQPVVETSTPSGWKHLDAQSHWTAV